MAESQETKCAKEWLRSPAIRSAVAEYIRLEKGSQEVLEIARGVTVTFLKDWLTREHFELASHWFAVKVLDEAVRLTKERRVWMEGKKS